jgi:hypothetical protein
MADNDKTKKPAEVEDLPFGPQMSDQPQEPLGFVADPEHFESDKETAADNPAAGVEAPTTKSLFGSAAPAAPKEPLFGSAAVSPAYAGPSRSTVNTGEAIPLAELSRDEGSFLKQNPDVARDQYFRDKALAENDLRKAHEAKDPVALHYAYQALKDIDKRAELGKPASAHPGLFGKIAHGAALAGNIAGDLLAPGAMSLIPGTMLNKNYNDALKEDKDIAAIDAGADINLKNAEADAKREEATTGKASDFEIKTDDLGNMYRISKSGKVAPQLITFGPQGQPTLGPVPAGAQVPGSTPTAQPTFGAKPEKQPVGDAGAQRHTAELNTLTEGMSPDDKQKFLDAYSVSPTDALEVQTKRLEDAKASAALSGSERDRALQREIAKRNHEDQQAQLTANNDRKDRSEQIKYKQEIAKIYADPLVSAERYNIMTSNLTDAIDKHDQQAMLSLLANHLGMTMGLQKGARLNQAIIDEAAKSQPWMSSIKAKYDKDGYLSGLTLSPDQMKSMVNLARERYKEDVVKARNVAKYAGADAGDDGPDRVPSHSTMLYYLGLANGDVNKAKQLAEEDGWSDSSSKPKGK